MRSNGAVASSGGRAMRLASLAGVALLLGAAACTTARSPDPAPAEIFALALGPEQVGVLLERLRERAAAAAADLGAADAARLIDALPEEADSIALEDAATAVLASAWRPAMARAAADFYGSPSGSRIRAVELSTFLESDPESFSDFVDALFERPVPVARVDMLARLARATRADEVHADLEVGVMRIVLRGVQALGARDPSDASADIESELARVRAQARGSFRMMETVLFQYAYRNASDSDIERYVAFAESAPGAWLFASLHAAVQSLTVRIGDDVVRTVRAESRASIPRQSRADVLRRCSSSSSVRGQSFLSRRDSARSASSLPPVWQVAQ